MANLQLSEKLLEVALRRPAFRSHAGGLDPRAVEGAVRRARQTSPTVNVPRFVMQPSQAVGGSRPLVTSMVAVMVCNLKHSLSIELFQRLMFSEQAKGH